MTSTKLQETETVNTMFHNMSLGEEPIDLDLAKKWINECMPDGNIIDKFACHLFKGGINEGTKKIAEGLCQKHDIDELLNNLKNHRKNLISLLVYLKYTWNNANLIIDTFLDSIEAYQTEFKVSNCSFYYSKYCEMFSSDMLLNVRLLARSFFKGQYLILRCSKSCDLLPFYLFLADLVKNIKLHIIDPKEEPFKAETVKENNIDDGVWSGLVNLRKSDVKNQEAYLKERRNSPCPMIITEDADIDAAMDSFKKSICQAQVQSGSTVSHILIQESIYERSILLLENSLKRIRHGSRFDKRTELELIDNESYVDKTSHLNLKIFCPCDKFPVKLCVGWNPKDIDDDCFTKSSGFITVIPYRNLSELKSLVNCIFKKKICPASIWSENVAVIKLQFEFEFSPLWINCHGLTHPLFPHYTPYIYSTEESFPGKDISWLKKTDPLSALYCAQKGFCDWQKFQLDSLEPLLNFLSSTETSSSCTRKGCLNQRVRSEIKKLVDPNLRLVSEALISNSCQPVGVIIIYIPKKEFSFPTFSFQRLVAASLINGNTVIVIAKDDLTLTSCKEASQVFHNLPDSVLGFLVERDFTPKLLLGRINSNDKFSCRLLCLGKDLIFQVNNLYDLSLIQQENCFCNEVLNDLTSRNRCVWTS